MRQAGQTPPPKPGVKKWQVNLEAIGARARAMKGGNDEVLASPAAGQLVKQLQREHEKYKRTLELIADGGDAQQLAQEVLGVRRPYAELAEENRQLMQIVEMYESTLKAIRLGVLKPEDLPDMDAQDVDDGHTVDDQHPAGNG